MITYSPTQLAVATEIFSFFSPTDKLGPMGAVAAVVNAACESSLKPDAIGDHDKAFGLFQVHADADIRALVTSKDPDPAKQCAFLWHDFQTTEHHALGTILASKTSADATYNWTLHYERPAAGASEASRRAGLAEQWRQHFGVAA